MSSSHKNASEKPKKLKVSRKNKYEYTSINNYYQVESGRVCGFGVSHRLVHLLSEKESHSVVLMCPYKILEEVELPLEYNGKESFHSNVDMLILFFVEQ